MRKTLTDAQIEQARAMRKEGLTYTAICAAIGAGIESRSIRAHCLDIVPGGKVRRRFDLTRMGKDGRVIRPFSDIEDSAIVVWHADQTEETMSDLARRIGRQRHSIAARIKTLIRHGRIPA